MVDPETAKAGLQALATAIAEIMEGVQDLAIRPLPSKLSVRATRIANLRAACADLAALVAAMEVLESHRIARTT